MRNTALLTNIYPGLQNILFQQVRIKESVLELPSECEVCLKKSANHKVTNDDNVILYYNDKCLWKISVCVKVKKYQGLYSSNYQYPLHPLGASIPVCTCPSGYVGNGYGPNGCTQISNICQTNNPCIHGQCVVSLCYILPSFSNITCTMAYYWH